MKDKPCRTHFHTHANSWETDILAVGTGRNHLPRGFLWGARCSGDPRPGPPGGAFLLCPPGPMAVPPSQVWGLLRTCGVPGGSACRVPRRRPARDWRTGVPDRANAATAHRGAPQGAGRECQRPSAPDRVRPLVGTAGPPSDPPSLHLQGATDHSTWSPACPAHERWL